MMTTTITVNAPVFDRPPALPPTFATPILETVSGAAADSPAAAAVEAVGSRAPKTPATSAVARRRKRIRTGLIKRRRQTLGGNGQA